MAAHSSTVSTLCCPRTACQQRGHCNHRRHNDGLTPHQRKTKRLLEIGLCIKCGKLPLAPNRSSCIFCLAAARNRSNTRYRRLFGPVKENGPKQDLAGKTFGIWEVVRLIGKRPSGKTSHWFWEVKCINCSTSYERITGNIRRSRCRKCHLLPQGEAGCRSLYRLYRRHASQNGRLFTLSLETFRIVTSKPCHYCGVAPSQVKEARTRKAKYTWCYYTYNGLDRSDNAKGYTLANVAPCCKICNRAKQSMPQDEFIAYIRRIIDNGTAGVIPCAAPLSEPA